MKTGAHREHAMADGSLTSEDRYETLCDRAVDFITAGGGIVLEDALISHVFGNSGSLNLWRPLLRRVLNDDARVVFHANGEWSLASRDEDVGETAWILDDFVALDVETTGLKPSQHRIIEVAAIRYQAGREIRAFETCLNPDRKIPEFITRLTTITNAHVDEAPRFPEVAQDLLDFIGDAMIIGHNVQFDLGFLNAELGRIDREPVMNERLDTMGLAVRLLKTLRKPSLDRVADTVGLSPRNIHRAGGDARLTAEVALRLVNEAQRQGVRSIDQLKASGRVMEARVRDDVGRARSLMDRTLAHAMPKLPGCYLMRDRRGEIIYVGKAKNLRNRVSSYYSQPIGYTRKMDGLIEAVQQIDHEIVGSELEALLLEAQLIRRYHPRYNTALKKSEHYPYIKVDVTNPWPRVLVAKAWKNDGAQYFGPYRSASAARRTVDAINQALPLRTCTRSFKNAKSYGKPCLALELGQCAGPCTGVANADDYRAMIGDVLRFLDGTDDALHGRLHAELESAAERLDFEKAERLRKSLRSVMTITEEQKRLQDAEHLHNLLVVLPSADSSSREWLLVLKGRLWAQFRVRAPGADDSDDHVIAIRDHDQQVDESITTRIRAAIARHNDAAWQISDRESVDLAAILNRFLFRNVGHAALIPLEMTDDGLVSTDVQSAISAADAVPNSAFATLDQPAVPEDAAPDESTDVTHPAVDNTESACEDQAIH